MTEPRRPDPDVLLARIKAEEKPKRGVLRIYLGAAPGVGKTFTALQEAQRRKARGTDVVVGFVETHGRPHTAEQVADLEVVPPMEIEYKGVTLRETDTDAVITRRPTVALVDELAHTNAPGSKHEKRYQDVEDILDAGINVISTVNIQHIESLNDYVKQMTGVEVRETLPDWVLDQAEQVELIDMAPEALIRRMAHGNIYPPEQAKRALENFFTVGNLSALRDLALRATAKEVELKLADYMRDFHVEQAGGIGDKVMVAVDHRPAGKVLIRRGWRIASALKAEMVVVYVEPDESNRQAQTVEDDRRLRSNLQLADELGARVVRLRGKVSEELTEYAKANHVANIVIGHPTHGRLREFMRGSVTNDLLRKLPGVDIHVVAATRTRRDGGASYDPDANP
jgi:two-component system, OmpR family, sensor histidine kinase KdpD